MIEKIGRYEILDKIGEGGFAVVYRANDTELDRLVALKELRPVLLTDKEWVKRFRREAKTIAHLDHAHIVTIYDVYGVNERLFIVMRLVNGPSLDELISSRTRLPWPQAIEIITSVAKGLDHAHTRGILHRDLKPANILMDSERGPMLTDFGLAKLASESSMSMTASGGVVGTPHYIAPEVWEGEGASRQSDIYALGCILFEMLTGEKIFKGETPPAVMMAHFKPPPLPNVWPEGVPPSVSDVLKTALASRPSDRYATVGEMATALTVLPGGSLQPTQPEVAEGISDVRDLPLADQNVTQLEPRSVGAAPVSLDTPVVKDIPPEMSRGREASSVRVKIEQFEDIIADLPPKWHNFLKNSSMLVIIVFILAMVNLFTSSYPWFIWVALAGGAFLAIRFVNLLFGDKKAPEISFPPITQSTSSTPSDPTSLATPVPSSSTRVQATNSVAETSTTTPILTQGVSEPPLAEEQSIASTEVPTPSQVVRARERNKRSGCMWITITLAGLLLLGIIGIGGFCSVFGTILNSAMPTVELGPTQIENISVAIPDTPNTPNLSLQVRGGQLLLSPGAKNDLVEGTVTYNVAQLKPQIDTNGNDVRIYPEEDIGMGALFTERLENSWDLMVSSVPLELVIDAGGVNTELELGNLSLADLVITHGGGNFQLSFSKPNQIEMKDLEFKGGASSATLTGLANAHAENISFEAGAGEFTLDFSGELQEDIDVDINSGLGEITIIVPNGVAAQVSSNGAMSGVEMTGEWQKSDDTTYVLPGEGHQISIKADIGLGNLILLSPEE